MTTASILDKMAEQGARDSLGEIECLDELVNRLLSDQLELAKRQWSAAHCAQPGHPAGGPGISPPPSSAASGIWNCSRHWSRSASLIGKVWCGAFSWRCAMRASWTSLSTGR